LGWDGLVEEKKEEGGHRERTKQARRESEAQEVSRDYLKNAFPFSLFKIDFKILL
jgi:hypothetical protein